MVGALDFEGANESEHFGVFPSWWGKTRGGELYQKPKEKIKTSPEQSCIVLFRDSYVVNAFGITKLHRRNAKT